ncbi:hypothetical protein GQ457_16G016820 [Hibiscus cannabinus]
MASNSGNFYESQSITKPSFFNGDNYPYWKNRMMLFIKSNDYQVWDVAEDDPFIPLKREGDRLIPKEVWDTLETTYEGTNDVKETKIGILNLSYENFKMEPDENVTKMFDRFSVIVNGLKGFGEIILEDKLVRKLLYSLPESWDSKRTAIIEAKDLETLKLDALMGSLFTHEIMKSECPQLKKKSFGKKKKLKAQIATWSDEESSDEEEQEVANLCDKFYAGNDQPGRIKPQ